MQDPRGPAGDPRWRTGRLFDGMRTAATAAPYWVSLSHGSPVTVL